ncbi:hypothetical protein FOPG_18198 [Fusarium oxysporum f. sp. conglutinans race 2 54008]|uniref:BZIP domain-containing protein n=3 Tax=Fusarium oxysporum f. sp. conglutinans TaxID=100902 RepID=A0A8H6LLR3_FUSOX|nr:hypothetical protein FOXB_17485 [Fusarium oxysporum f. sp. conglutinans Fo5176]EXL65581.1 hypothetical protein FOPG_18198 [Fusarium oxysporum f. sp. conglutinans race 2 54008]KAF6524794.1 hypothetical protein HZS61_010589 [Fusarium oxysporum f. sp. conglutinans]KAG6995885.1 hypothetical protein FocnCong_v016248 [Fusarium oxysporum f. sp. conglutinans]KAH7463392.1 hypothetical protein FOMA001_g18059 [Fusarium oxysporum f. sp. matthiolae]
MIRSSSAEPAKPRRKGTRSVSTLTPVQLARKRANDREAQRAIRARTKEHIERLERELAELKSEQGRDQTVQELLRRNEAIEKELIRLKETMRVPTTSSPYSAPGLTPQQLSLPDELLMLTVYDGNLCAGSDAIPSPRGSPFPGDYNSLPDYNSFPDNSQQYVPLSNNCESLASTVSCPIPSSVSIPSSSADYGAGYIPISVPTSILSSNNSSSSSISAMCDKDVVKIVYDDVGHHGTIPQELRLPDVKHGEEFSHTQCLDARFRLSNPPLHPGTPYSNTCMPHH